MLVADDVDRFHALPLVTRQPKGTAYADSVGLILVKAARFVGTVRNIRPRMIQPPNGSSRAERSAPKHRDQSGDDK